MQLEPLLTDIIFAGAAILSIVFALLVVAWKNPIYSVFFLINMFFALAVIFVLCFAPFIAIIQILVYGGAIMVLYSFVIMMINMDKDEYIMEKTSIFKRVSGIIVFVFLLLIVLLVARDWVVCTDPSYLPELEYKVVHETETLPQDVEDFGSVSNIGELIFTEDTDNIYLLTFELVSLLIFVAVIGAIILTKRIRRPE